MDQDVNETINHVESAMKEIIHDAAEAANSLASNITCDIEEIISKATKLPMPLLIEVENNFYRDTLSLDSD